MYATSLQHILAELERLDLLLRIQVWRARQGRGEAGELAAFYIPEAEADEFLNKTLGAPVWAGIPLPPELREVARGKLDQLSAEVGGHAAESLAQDIPLRLVELGRMFGLTEFDLDVILLCLAPELDRGYERLYAYLHDDLTRRRPTVELALNLFCPDLTSRVAARTRLTQAGPLRASRLVDLADEPGSMLGSSLRLEPRVAGYLLGDDSVDDRLRPYTRLVPPAVSPAGPVPDALARLAGQVPEAGKYAVNKKGTAYSRREAAGYMNPKQSTHSMIPVFERSVADPIPTGLSNQQKRKWLDDPTRQYDVISGPHGATTRITGYKTRPGPKGKMISAVVLGHHPGYSASALFNAPGHGQPAGHTVPRAQNQTYNYTDAPYHGLEDYQYSASTGHLEPPYESPRPDRHSHRSYWDPTSTGHTGGPWRSWKRVPSAQMITYIENKLTNVPVAQRDVDYYAARAELSDLKLAYTQARARELLSMINTKNW